MSDAGPLVLFQGAVREGAQAIENLLHLLGSRRVGPKAIGSALVDVREGCPTMRVALADLKRELCDLLVADEDASALVGSLLDQSDAAVTRLAEALAAVKTADVDARARLAIEAATRAAESELSGALFLVDLLACAATPRITLLDARDVLQGDAIARDDEKSRKPAPPADDRETRMTFSGDARLVGSLLSLVKATIEQASGATPRVEVSAIDGDRVRVRICAANAPSAKKEAPMSDGSATGAAPRALPAAAIADEADAAIRAAARLASIELSGEASSGEITLVLGRGKGAE